MHMTTVFQRDPVLYSGEDDSGSFLRGAGAGTGSLLTLVVVLVMLENLRSEIMCEELWPISCISQRDILHLILTCILITMHARLSS